MGILALEDGRVFRGESFGAPVTSHGEVCFNTSMTGYQEILTDPSYRGQIIAMTHPHIGNYGVNPLDVENASPQVRGFVIEELSPVVSNWRATASLDSYLADAGIPGLQGIDTRALTKHLRERGAMRACISGLELSDEEAVQIAKDAPGILGSDFVREVTATESYDWDPAEDLSREWTLVQGTQPAAEGMMPDVFLPLPPAEHFIVAYDYGVKKNILRNLRQHGFQVRVVPALTPVEDVLAMKPDGVFLTNGPGDPAALDYAHKTAKSLANELPVFGICLGCQILGIAYGGTTFKLKFGHRGANQPVKNLLTGAVAITSQNHGFALEAASLPDCLEVTHLNLNDGTVAGIRHRELPVSAVQFHPEASPGPHDAQDFFGEFANLIASRKKSV